MTTAAYFALTLAHEMAQEVFMSATDLTADMAETGLRYAVMIDGRPAQYIAHDQEVSKGKLVTLDLCPAPENDNVDTDAVPAAASSAPRLEPGQAMFVFMQRLASNGAPLWTRLLARDWLRLKSRPGAMQRGWSIFEQIAQRKPYLLNHIDPDGSLRFSLRNGRTSAPNLRKHLPATGNRRARMKLEHAAVPKTMLITSRFFERNLKHGLERAILAVA